MRIETVKIAADNPRGFKIVNADDPRAQPAEKKPRGRKPAQDPEGQDDGA